MVELSKLEPIHSLENSGSQLLKLSWWLEIKTTRSRSEASMVKKGVTH